MTNKFHNNKDMSTYDTTFESSFDNSFQENEEETCEEITNFIVAEACRVRRLVKNGGINYERKSQALKSIYSAFTYLFKLEKFISKDLSDDIIHKIRTDSEFYKYIEERLPPTQNNNDTIKNKNSDNYNSINNKINTINNDSNNTNILVENENNSKIITFNDLKSPNVSVDDSVVYPKQTTLNAALKTKKSCPNFSYNKEVSDINSNNSNDNIISQMNKKPLEDTYSSHSFDYPSTINNSATSSSNNTLVYKQDSIENGKSHDENKNNGYHHNDLGSYLPKNDSESDLTAICSKTCNTPVSEATLIENQNHATPLYNSQKFYINSASSTPDKSGPSYKNQSLLTKTKNRNNSNQSNSTFINPPNSTTGGNSNNNSFDVYSNQNSSNNSPKTMINDGSLYNSSNNTSSGQLNNINLCFSSSSLSSDFVNNNPSLMSYSPSSINSQPQLLNNSTTSSNIKNNHSSSTSNLQTNSSSIINSNLATTSSSNNNSSILNPLNLNINSGDNGSTNNPIKHNNDFNNSTGTPTSTKVKSYSLNKNGSGSEINNSNNGGTNSKKTNNILNQHEPIRTIRFKNVEIDKNAGNNNHSLRSKNTTSTPDIAEKALGHKKNVRNCKSYADLSLSGGNRRNSLSYSSNLDDSITESSFIESSSEDSSMLTDVLKSRNAQSQYHSVINPQQSFEATYDAYKNSKNKNNNSGNRKSFVSSGNKGFKVHSLISSSNHAITSSTPNNNNIYSRGAYTNTNANTKNNYDKPKDSQQQQRTLKVKKRISSLDIKKYYFQSMNNSGNGNNGSVNGPSSLPQNYSSFNSGNGNNNNSIEGKPKRNSLEKGKTNNRKSYHQDIQENIDLMKEEQSFISDFSESILNEIKDSNTINNLCPNFNDYNLSSSYKNKSILSNSSSDANIAKEINSIIPDYFNSNNTSNPLKSSTNSMKSRNSMSSLLNNENEPHFSNTSSITSNNSNNSILNMNSSIMHNGSFNGSIIRNNSNNTSILHNNSNNSNNSSNFSHSNNTLINGQANKKNSFIKANRNSIYSDDNKSFEDLQHNHRRLSNSKKNVDDLNRRSSKPYEYDKEITLINDEEEKENIFNKRQPSNCSNKTHCSASSSLKKNKSINSNGSVKKDSKSECQFILKELIENEISFSNNLDILMNFYRYPLKDNNIISNIDLNCIFYGVPELAEFSKNLCQELQDAMNEEDNILYVSRVLISQVEKWDYYLRYCENYSQSKTTVKVLSKNSSKFNNFLKKAQSDNKCNKQDINSLLILPVQHGCRYPLLLARLKEKITADADNYNPTTIKMVDAAECYMKKLGVLLNDLQQSDEFSKYASESELENKFKIPLSIEDCPVSYFISKDRRLLKGYDCYNTNTNKNIRIFIFGDLIMQTICQKSSESDLGIKYRYLRIDPIENVMVQESDVNFGNTYQKAILNRFKKHDSNENYVKISYSTSIFGEENYIGQPMTYTLNFSDRKMRKEFLSIFETTKALYISNVLNVAARAIPPEVDDVLVTCSNYDRRSDKEISISLGDEAVAYEKALDGWVQGENCTTHQCGYFPISVFVESDSSRDIYDNAELKVKYTYKQKGDGEISINSGDTVVPETYYHSSGWCYGKNLSSNESGLFPLSFCRIQPGIVTNPGKLKTHVMNQLSKPIIISKKKHSSLPLAHNDGDNGHHSYFNLNKELPVAVPGKKTPSNNSFYSQTPPDMNDNFNYRTNSDGVIMNHPSDIANNFMRMPNTSSPLTMDMESDDEGYLEDRDLPIPPQPEPVAMISSPLIKRRSTSLDYNLESIQQLSSSNYDYDDETDTDDWSSTN